MGSFSADRALLSEFARASDVYVDALAAQLSLVATERARVVAALGPHGIPGGDGGAFEELLERAKETNRHVASVVGDLGEATAIGVGGVRGSVAVGSSLVHSSTNLIDGSFLLESVDAGGDLFRRGVGAGARLVARRVSEFGDAADDAIVDALPYVAAGAEVVADAVFDEWYPTVADGVNRYVAPVVVGHIWSQLDQFIPDRPTTGDPGGAFTSRPTGDRLTGGSGVGESAGRRAVIEALDDTADAVAIRNDEFQLIRHDDTTYTVVLAGVVDLTNPTAGFDQSHQSARDTDAVAVRSSQSADTGDNLYALMVLRSLRANQVPAGSNIMIVGHSLGADTALDLAADPFFNGDTFNVTHVVAAAYHSEPQLDHVQPGTEVLVLQNNKDIPVIVENLGHWSNDPYQEFTNPPEGIVVREFDGGWAGLGHHQDNYTSYLREVTHDQEIDWFFNSLANAGYGRPGAAVAIDVSVS